MLVPDIIFLLPFTTISTSALGIRDSDDSSTALLLGLLRLLQLVSKVRDETRSAPHAMRAVRASGGLLRNAWPQGRLYRLSAFVSMIEYRMVLPQTAIVVLRNNLYVLGSCHVAGEWFGCFDRSASHLHASQGPASQG